MVNRRSLLFLSISILLLASNWFANAEETTLELSRQPVTLKKAIDYALVHNRTLLAARQDSHVADQRVKQAKADFYPKVDANYTFRKLNEQPFARFSGAGAPGGGSGVKINTAHSETNHWEINLIQPVFTGFGLTAQLNISKMDRKIAEYRLEETRLNVVRDVQHTFLQTLLGERLLQVAGDNVKSLDVHRQNAEAQYQQGLTAKNDVLKAEVALAQAQQQERSTAKQLILLRSRLNQLLDLDLQTHLDLSEEDIEPHTAAALAELYSRAEKRRPEYLVLETSIRQSEEGVTAAKSRYYPRVSLFGQYFREGEDFLAETNEFTNNENGAVGVRVDWNLFEGGRMRAEVSQWGHRREALRKREQDLLKQVRIEVKNSYEQLQVAARNLATARVAVKQAEENLRMTTIQYQQQVVISSEVLDAQVFLTQARTNYYQALYGYQLAWVDLERAVGESL